MYIPTIGHFVHQSFKSYRFNHVTEDALQPITDG